MSDVSIDWASGKQLCIDVAKTVIEHVGGDCEEDVEKNESDRVVSD